MSRLLALALSLIASIAFAVPRPFVPGEILVQVRGPATSLNKATGWRTQALPGMIRAELTKQGLLSEKPLATGLVGNKTSREPSSIKGVFLLRFDKKQPVADLVAAAQALPGISRAEPNYLGALCVAPNDPHYLPNQKEVFDLIGMEKAWDITTGSPDITIAVLDSGIDATHPDLNGRVLPGHNFITDTTNTADSLGHGTRVAGIIGARGNDGVGMSGVCWDCQLLPVVIADLKGQVTAAAVIEGLDWAWRGGADVINMSFVIAGQSEILEKQCRDVSEDCLLVGAAGNEGQKFVPRYPAGYESVLSVGAVDQTLHRASFSNFNYPGVNEFIDLAAPGVDLFSPTLGTDYNKRGGTSLAAPLVSGVAALLRSRYPHQSPGAIRAHIERHASPIGTMVSSGLLRADNALEEPMLPLLFVANVTIQDSPDLSVANDSDGALDGGETAQIVVGFRNMGSDKDDFEASLSCSSSDVTIVTSTASFPGMEFDGIQSKNLAQPFSVQVAAPAQQEVTFTLHVPGLDPLWFNTIIEDETAVPQSITSDLTLTPDHTWMISGLTTVATGGVLTAEPGATVKFEENARLECFGPLSSVGTSDNPIHWKNHTPPPQEPFKPSREYPVGEAPESVALGDLNGDGVTDIVTANSWDNNVSVLLGDGAGDFLPEVTCTVGVAPESVALRDLNGDGVTDIVTANKHSDDVSVLLGSGAGVFDSELRYSVGDTIGEYVIHASPGWHLRNSEATKFLCLSELMAIADCDGDGVIDIVTANEGSNNVSVLLGDRAGGFLPEDNYTVGRWPRSVALGDIDGGGVPDIVTANYYDHNVSVLLGEGAGAFFPEVTYPVGEYPACVALGDVDGDGVPDIVTANSWDNNVSVLLGDGAGGFLSQARYPVGERPWSVALGDMDGNGVTDIVTADVEGDDVSVLSGDGDRGFPPPKRYLAGEGSESAVLDDLDGDGVTDIVTANSSDNDVSVLFGDGVGGFRSRKRFSVGDEPRSVTSGDVDGDGVTDIVTANYGSGNVSVLLGDGAGGFPDEQRYPVGQRPESVALGDLNGDGVADIVIANASSYDVSVLLGDGASSFLPEATHTVGDWPRSVALGDIDGDGATDIVTGNAESNDVSVLNGNGAGGFLTQARYAVGREPLSVALGDVDGDGHTDIVTANYSGDDISVLRGTVGGGFLNRVEYRAGFRPESVALGDLNGDEVTDIVVANGGSGDVSVLSGDGNGGFRPEINYAVGESPRSVVLGDVDGDRVIDIVTANSDSGDVSVLSGDGGGGFYVAPQISVHSLPVEIEFATFEIPGAVVLKGGGTVSSSEFRSSGTTGLSIAGDGVVRACTTESCFDQGFVLAGFTGTAMDLVASNNRGSGIQGAQLIGCRVEGNAGHGIMATGTVENCSAIHNNGVGLSADAVRSCTSIRNLDDGIRARGVEDSLSVNNYHGTGILASERVTRCVAIANGHGIQAPTIENSIVLGSFGNALASDGLIDDSAILENAAISSDTIHFNNTVIADNAESATLDQIDGMYIAGNFGGGVEGIPVTNSTIIGNKGPGIMNNISVASSNIVFNTGEGVVDGEVVNSFVSGNWGGDLVGEATGILATSPIEEAPAFLASVTIELSNTIAVSPDARRPQAIGVGGAEFILTYSKDMDISKGLWVTFGQSSPYTPFILQASPGWWDNRTWVGFHAIGYEVGSGTHTLRVSGARTAEDPPFDIPPDTYHRFVVDLESGLSLTNPKAVALGPNGMRLTWDALESSRRKEFRILRSRHSGEDFEAVGSATAEARSYDDWYDLSPDTTYYYRIHEVYKSNNSDSAVNEFHGKTTEGTPLPTPTYTLTPTATFTPTTTNTPTPCHPYDLAPDCQIDSRDLLEAMKQGFDTNEVFDFSRMWMSGEKK